jgi:hypothetical protein
MLPELHLSLKCRIPIEAALEAERAPKITQLLEEQETKRGTGVQGTFGVRVSKINHKHEFTMGETPTPASGIPPI